MCCVIRHLAVVFEHSVVPSAGPVVSIRVTIVGVLGVLHLAVVLG